MNDYWNDPPDYPDPPECCDEYMDVCKDSGVATCATCQRRIEPEPDIEPVLEKLPDDFADVELGPACSINNPDCESCQ